MRIENRCHSAPWRAGTLDSALVLGTLLAVLCGCSPAAPKRSSSMQAPPSKPTVPTESASTGWAWLEATQVPLRIRLPYGAEWQRRETKTSMHLEHGATHTRLVVRLWPASRQVTADQCLGELRLLDLDADSAALTWHLAARHRATSDATAPGEFDPNIVAEKSFAPGVGFDGFLCAGVIPTKGQAMLQGTVLGVSASVGHCVALVATTSVDTSDSEQQLAARLAWIVEGTAPSIALRTVESRVNAAR